MNTELLSLDHDEEEVQEKAIRRSDLIRAKYGTLAKFLESLSGNQSDAEVNIEELAQQLDQ